MRLKQRDATREAMVMAAAMVEEADFDSLFGDMANEGETDSEIEHNEAVMEKAQAAVVLRLRKLAGA